MQETRREQIPPSWYAYTRPSPSCGAYLTLPSPSPRPPLYLTTFHTTDAASLQALLSEPLINDRLIRIPTPYLLSDAESWIALQASGTALALPLQAIRISSPSDGTLIGALGLRRLLPGEYGSDGNGDYELGYYLSPEFRGSGIMRDAVMAVITWGVKEEGVKKVMVQAEENNLGSRGIIASICKFEEVGGTEVLWPEEKGGGKRWLRKWWMKSEGIV